MSLIIRYVDSSSDNISIEESFLGFLDVNDTTGQGLFDVLLKSYLRSTMTQERLNSLAMIALESGLLDKINYEHVIEDFISKNTKRMMLFK